NPLLRGWCNFYRHAWGASRVFRGLEHYVWWAIFRWLRKKHRGVGVKALMKRYAWRKPGQRTPRWCDGGVDAFRPAYVHLEHFKLGWQRPPAFALTPTESPVHNERCTPGSGMGRSETTQ